MTPEDWQRLWQGHERGGPRNSPADLLVRSQRLVDSWKNMWLYSVVGAMFILMAGLRLFEWNRKGTYVVLLLSLSHLAFGVAYVVYGVVGVRLTRNVPPAVTVVDFYRKLLDIERRRSRWSVPVIILSGIQLFAVSLAASSVIPSFQSRLWLAAGSVVAVSVMAVYTQRHLARRLREIRDLPDDT